MLDEITEDKLKNVKRELLKYDETKIKGDFIFTEEAGIRIQKLYNQFKSNNPIMLEGPTGTSKTKTIQVLCDLQNLELIRINLSSETTIEDLMGRLISDKDNSFSGFTYKEGAFAEAYSKGKVLLLDEVNLAPNPVLQCMLTALDSNKITQSVPGIGLKTFERHQNFRIVATQNPKSGAFSTTRDRLSTKFLETFQVVEFPEFTAEELSKIAHKAAKKKSYKNDKVIDQISEFHNEWVKSEFSKKSPQCYTVRDLNISIKSIAKGKSPEDVISCFYGSRYEKDVYEIMENILQEKYRDLYKPPGELSNLPIDFPKCFPSNSIKQAFEFAKMGVENGKHLLLIGKEEIGLTQTAKWISSYFSKNKKENFLFVFTPETTVADLLGRYVPSPQTEEKSNIMNWEDGPLTKAIKEGYSGVFTNISSAQTKVAERLNGLFDPKDTEDDYFFDLSENAENPIIPINKNFLFVATCNTDKLKELSPALLNRFMVINLSDQLENLKNNDILELIKIILENEYGELHITIDMEIINLIFEKYRKYNYSMSKLSKFAKSVYRLYLECEKKIDKVELIDYTEKLLFGEKNIFYEIPLIIKNKADNLFGLNKQTSSDEKFYFKNSKSLKTLMIHLYACSICRVPICLVGSTGLGKTSMARAFSEYARNEVAIMYSFHLETQIDDIYGTFTFENGKPVIIDGPLTLSLKQGKLFIADEFNLAENTILQTLSIAFENNDESSCFLIPGIGSKINYNKNFFIACQNDLSTTGRKKLPHVIEKRLRMFEYPSPELEDLKKSCEDIIKENISDKIEYKISNAEKMANFMYKINKLNDTDIGTWSMRNIRKIFRRNAYQQLNKDSYINVTFELQIVIFILGDIPINRREVSFEKVMKILLETFEMDEISIKNIRDVIKDKSPRIEIIKERGNKKFLFKGKSGIEIGNEYDGLECLNSLLETVYYAKFAHFKEPINFCGPSSYKTFLAQKFAIGAPVLNLYPETSIGQLLGSVALVNNIDAKIYFLEEILKICGNEEKIMEYKLIIQKYFEEKKKEEKILKGNQEDEEDEEEDNKEKHHKHHHKHHHKDKKKDSDDDSEDEEDKKVRKKKR